MKAREAISGTGDRGNPASFDVTEWTEWSSASKETFVEDDSIKVNTEIIKHYTGVVDVALPGSDQKLYKEGIEAADDADIEAIMDLLYAYFEGNKATVPELANVAKADLTTEMVLTRIESSRTVGSINTEGDLWQWYMRRWINITISGWYTKSNTSMSGRKTGPATAHITGKPARQRAAPKRPVRSASDSKRGLYGVQG